MKAWSSCNVTFITPLQVLPERRENVDKVKLYCNLMEMSDLKVPIAIIIGEGGSGGALSSGSTIRFGCLRIPIYSILSPEGFATILLKDGSRSEEAAVS